MIVDEFRGSEVSGLSVRYLRNKRTRGGGPPFYKIGRMIRYDEDELIAWVRSHRARSTTDADQRRAAGATL